MNDIATIVDKLKNTASYTSKQQILEDNKDNKNLLYVLHHIYNPYQKTGIAAAKLNKMLRESDTKARNISYVQAIEYFTENNTGAQADVAFGVSFIRFSTTQYGKLAGNLAEAIVTQRLKIGVDAKTLNKIYGKGFIPMTGCMLGTKIDKVKNDSIAWPCIVTEKLDGVRRVLVKERGHCRLYSRSGHEDTGLLDVTREAQFLPDNTVYDGELLAAGIFTNCIEQRQATNSLSSVKGDKHGLVFNVFDMIPLDEFKIGKSKNDAFERKLLLGALFMDDSISTLSEKHASELISAYGMYHKFEHIKYVPILGLIRSADEIKPIADTIWAVGGEGVMLNIAGGVYDIKRSKDLLKVKHIEEHTLEVVDVLEGIGKYSGKMGALVLNYRGRRLGVGSGFTDLERELFWNNKDAILGRSVEIDCFGESQNKEGLLSLNCPIFKRVAVKEGGSYDGVK